MIASVLDGDGANSSTPIYQGGQGDLYGRLIGEDVAVIGELK